MLRVYATIKQSEYANTFKYELQDIANWVQEIHAGVYPHLVCLTNFSRYSRLHIVFLFFYL